MPRALPALIKHVGGLFASGTRAGVFVCLLLAGLGLRAFCLTGTALWLDEAESGINALSILERGYPADRYLGIPVYENMLIRQWPEHPEYEFKDLSYSDNGMAVYHGWLPLYAIAASFKALGIEATEGTPGWQIDVTPDEMKRRTLAARLPSWILSGVFLALMFASGRRLAGDDAALPALILAGLSASLVDLTMNARYYAAMLALSAAAMLTLWRVLNQGRRRDYALHTVVLILLFYTHLIALVNIVALTTLALLFHARNWRAARRWAAALLATGLCATPWLLATGYVEHLRHMPSGLGLVRFPEDLLSYVSSRVPYLVLFLVGALWLVLAWLCHGTALPNRLREPWQQHHRQYSLLLCWLAIATATYFLFSPPASLFPQRLSLALFVPGLLFMAMTLADAARTISRSLSAAVTPVLALAFLAVSGLLRPPAHDPDAFRKLALTFESINRLRLEPDAKVYASPSDNHVLAFYSGKPIQSLAPVRKSFLDSYPGEVLYIEHRFSWQFAAPSADDIEAVARRLGLERTPAEIEALRAALESRFAREQTRPAVADVVPPLEQLSPLAREVMRATRIEAEALADIEELGWENRNLPFARGFRIRAVADLWQTFFYRLVDPAARGGAGLNAADRLRGGRAHFLPEANRVFFLAPLPTLASEEHAGTSDGPMTKLEEEDGTD